jgi:hypothetical protein
VLAHDASDEVDELITLCVVNVALRAAPKPAGHDAKFYLLDSMRVRVIPLAADRE